MEIVNSTQAPKAVGPYSQAMRTGNLIFFSGQIPLHPESGEVVSGGFAEQCHRVLLNLQAVLAAASCDFKHVVKVNIFLKDLKNFTELNGIYTTYFGDHKPARSTIEVSRLPRDVEVEMEFVVEITP